jgi:Flp pilus assembly protein TadB
MDTKDILKKYSAKIEKEISGFSPNISSNTNESYSKSYQDFRESMTPQFSSYEKWCKSLGSFFKVGVSQADSIRIQKQIDSAHIDATPSEVVSFAVACLFISLFAGILIVVGNWLLFTDGEIQSFPVLLSFLVVLFSIFIFYFTYTQPQRLALQWRLKASAQMVPAILYIVIYMKHTSNLERAVEFASQHLSPPLSFDFKKIFWDVQIGRYSSVKDSLDRYLETWREYSLEFIESFHLIESSLYEPDEARRVEILERSLQVILDGVYDKMLKYTHDVKAPLTNIYMLGIVLTTLSLAILPLASSMLQGAIKWWHVMILFNVLVPFAVMYMTWNIMMSRPGGHGETSLFERNPLYEIYKSRYHYFKAGFAVFPIFIIGIIPLLWTYTNFPMWIGLKRDYLWSEIGIPFLGKSGIFGISVSDTGKVIAGPYGILSLVLSLFVPLAFALFFVIANSSKTKEIIKSRDQYKEVEKEFTSSLFQLGNRLGDGLPAEIAFSRVSDSVKGTATEGFFKTVNQNIQQLGMSLDESIFNPRRGALIFYPSELISMSMRVLVESVKKGLKVAARSLMSISEYVKNIRKIDERLNDLLAEIISDMKSNMTFLAPLLSGIIVGLAGMITSILAALGAMIAFQSNMGAGADSFSNFGGLGTFTRLFKVETMIPTYFLQIVIGIYLIEVTFILTSTLVTIKSGQDTLQRTSEIGKNLKISILIYFVIALLSIIGLSLIGSVALAGISAG